ncbi:N-acetylneuraminate synthase family protein [Candidatus Microgenomates bacterium]|nr:N-acetylneuraminate synthase family protein [Candidatus Microgenomates bacterium]
MKKSFDFARNFNSSDGQPIFILEMANNHMGDVDHGLRIIEEMSKVTKKYDFLFAFKFQYRDLETFIHPDYKKRMDLKYVKRFSETRLSEKDFLILKAEAQKLGFITMCTPFDEVSVDMVVKHDYDILKVASASCGDWPLLEKIVSTDKPIIFSTGGAKLEEIDKIVSFLEHRQKTFALEHCVGEYPTLARNLQLNQIDLLRRRYPNTTVGFSTHEEPDNVEAVKIAIAKGARIFEKHVSVRTDKYEMNAYSANPKQVDKWLQSAKEAYEMCGIVGERAPSSEKELADIRQFQRGVFAKDVIRKGERVDTKNTFFAFPNQPGQILTNDLSKYSVFTALKQIKKNDPVIDVSRVDTRDKVYEIVVKSRNMLADAKISVSNQLDFEISHHYGLDRFYEVGAVIITCVNREYTKKLIIVFPGQSHPSHGHKQKEETFHVLSGTIIFILDGKEREAKAGDVVVVERGVKHSFYSKEGSIFEEVSTTHIKSDSFYEDESISKNKNRKTELTYWVD